MKTSRWLSEITKAGNQNACDTVAQAKTKAAVLETVNTWSCVNTLYAEAQTRRAAILALQHTGVRALKKKTCQM